MRKTNIQSIGTISASVAAISLLAWFAVPARAENLEDLQQLMNTRECQGCDLNRAGLVHGNLEGVDLSSADLRGANLSRADLRGADLSGADLSRATLLGADLSEADLTGTNFAGADLREAYFTDAIIDGTVFEGTVMVGAVGLPPSALTPQELYMWGMVESRRGNYQGAIDYYTQAYEAQPDFANAVLARAIARYRMGDPDGAIADATLSNQLYLTANSQQGQEVSQQLIALATAYKEAGEVEVTAGRPNFLNFLTSLSGMALQFLTQGGFPGLPF
ncbi:MAG: pentapeptide repeat-containing protein [Synechococcales cyanobacterium T60_A2020_003]|nr:pentapeptide repeat-containing protein [Synechococcales cyanobacterium T60_A2020_003]